MGLRRRSEPEPEKWLEVSASMTGSLTFKDPVNLQINGRFEGTLDARGNLAIGPQAQVKATIRGEAVRVAGTVEGSITTSGCLELLGTARVTGKIVTASLIVHEGAVLHGTCEMTPARGGTENMTVDELARYLEVDAATVLEWAKAGRLPGRQDAGEWRFDRKRIEEWLAQEKIK